MAQNRMADVAKMFGKELDERFTIKWRGSKYDVSLGEYGLHCYHDFVDFDDAIESMMRKSLLVDFDDAIESMMLKSLLLGEAVIVDER